MWIVQLALRRPYTFIVAALPLLIVSPLVILRTPTDIVPNINIPVVSIVWQYTEGISPGHQTDKPKTIFGRFHRGFQNGFECLRETYSGDSPKAVPFRHT